MEIELENKRLKEENRILFRERIRDKETIQTLSKENSKLKEEIAKNAETIRQLELKLKRSFSQIEKEERPKNTPKGKDNPIEWMPIPEICNSEESIESKEAPENYKEIEFYSSDGESAANSNGKELRKTEIPLEKPKRFVGLAEDEEQEFSEIQFGFEGEEEDFTLVKDELMMSQVQNLLMSSRLNFPKEALKASELFENRELIESFLVIGVDSKDLAMCPSLLYMDETRVGRLTPRIIENLPLCSSPSFSEK